MQCCLIFQQKRRVFCKKIFLNVKIRQKGGRFHIYFTNLAMFSNISTEKAGILLENLPKCQNSSKRGRFHIYFTNLAMFSNFLKEKTGILLENLSECQNSSKRVSFAYNFHEPCNVVQFFNREDRYFARKSF